MLGLSQLSARLHSLEQTVQRSTSGAAGGLSTQPLPALEPTAPSHATLLGKLSELTSTFHSLASEPQLASYLASVPSIQALLASSPSAATPCARGDPAVTELVVGASDMFTRVSEGLELTSQLSPVLDQAWPLDATELASLTARVDTLNAALPQRAFQAAQQHVQFLAFLRSYAELIDLCNRQFVLWNAELERLEKEADRAAAFHQAA